MDLYILPIEFELVVINFLSKYYPNFHFQLIAENKQGLLIINSLGYCKRSNINNNSDYNPISEANRNKKVDFRIFWGNGHLAISGWWRNAILSLEYSPESQEWLNEDGEEISCPYPDGKNFEAIAAYLYPLFQHYFPSNYTN
ncbi:MAG TPA: hypothetical protein V6D25_31085 [Leptolyngbyaceae cyanobacterium]